MCRHSHAVKSNTFFRHPRVYKRILFLVTYNHVSREHTVGNRSCCNNPEVLLLCTCTFENVIKFAGNNFRDCFPGSLLWHVFRIHKYALTRYIQISNICSINVSSIKTFIPQTYSKFHSVIVNFVCRISM